MKRKRKMFSWRKALSLMAVMFLLLSSGMPVFASENASPDVAQARQGVLQINLVYVDSNGNSHVLQTGSGFLVGAASGATTVITNYHVVHVSEKDKADYSELYGVDFSNLNNINLQINVVVKRDVVIPATYLNGSEKTDFAILELSQAIHDRTPLKIADSSKTVETQEVFALGFPFMTSVISDDQVYTSGDVTITSGIINKYQKVDGIDFILHNAELGYGNSGGPLVDSNGNVIGVNTMYTGDGATNYFYSIAINEVADVMDALGVVYESADGSAPLPEVTEEPETEKTDENNVDTEAEVQPVPEPEPEPIIEPESSGMNMYLIIGIAAAVVVVIIIVVIIVVVNKSKKKIVPVNGMAAGNLAMPGNMGNPAASGRQMQQGMPTPPPFNNNTMPVDSGAGETSVLGVGAGETSVLGGGSMQPTATITRMKNGESVSIVKPNFSIGKERAKVDFCIPDNNSISRVHVNIVCRGGIYYIVDNNSTNFTFVNGNKINAGQEIRLNSGDKIKLSDEAFEFRV